MFYVLALLNLVSCMSDKETITAPINTNQNGSIAFQVKLVPNSPIQKTAKRAEIVVSAPDMITISQELSINDSSISGNVKNIPVGKIRNFKLRVFDSLGLECYSGSALGEIFHDSASIISIKLTRANGSAIINGTVSEGGESQALFTSDSSTVFLANFDFNLKDLISNMEGLNSGYKFGEGLFGSSIQNDSLSFEKSICRFSMTEKQSLTGNGSIEALVKVNKVSNGFMHIVDKSWQYGLTVYNGKLAVDFGTNWWYSSISVPIKKWSYIATTYNGSTLKLYLDGQLVDSTTYVRTPGSSAYGIGIGNAFDNNFNIPFSGSIDEVRISNIARSASEVTSNWNLILPKIPK